MALMIGCAQESDTTTGGEEQNPEEAARLAASADSLVQVMMGQIGTGTSEDILGYVEEAKTLYQGAANKDHTNGKANFFAGLFGLQSVVDNQDLKMIQNKLQSWAENPDTLDIATYYVTRFFMFGEHEVYIDDGWGGAYHEMNPGAAFLTLISLVQNSLSNPDLITLLQNTIDQNLIPELDTSITYMDRVLSDNTFTYMLTPEMTGEDTALELDLGEAYMISALLHLTRGSLKILNAYRLGIPGATTSDYFRMASLFPKVKDQDINDGNFLKLRSTSLLPSAKTDILTAIDRIADGAVFIAGETDSQLDDLIKKENLTEANQGITEDFGTDIPIPVLAGAQGISDLADGLTTMLNSTFTVQLNSDTGVETMSISLAAFFNNAMSDIKDFLPYHAWVDLDAQTEEFQPLLAWDNQDMGSATVYEVQIMNAYQDAMHVSEENRANTQLVGTFSQDGVFTVQGAYDWWTGESVSLSPGANLTTDGAFYLDSQNRFCITQSAYNMVNDHMRTMERNTWQALDYFYSLSMGMPQMNYSASTPFGIRQTNPDGVLKFSGSLEYVDDNVEWVYLTDSSGGSRVDSPVFPDPTFGGILPGMTQTKLMGLTQ